MTDLATYWRLSPAVTACLAANRVVFLDLPRDRYRALPGELTAEFVSWLRAPLADLPQACRLALADLGLTAAAAAIETPQPYTLDRPHPLDAKPLAASRVSIAQVAEIARAVVSAWREVRTGPLVTVLARRMASFSGGVSGEADLETRLATFRSVRPLIPVPRICLHDCLALMEWIAPAAPEARLVFGVSAAPFAAHCWIQADRWVLDDHPESPSRFSPILHLP